MKKILIVLMLLVPLLPLRAQITHSDNGQVDKTAAEVLKRAAARFEQNVSFTVSATILDGQGKQLLKQSAQVCYHKGKYHLTMPDQELICDGTTVWQWNKQAREVAVQNVGASDEVDLLNPGRLLANYQRQFKAKYIRTDADGTAVIDLQPRAARSYHKIRVLVNEESGLLRRLEVHKYDSGREFYDISQFKRTANGAAVFTFDAAKHPGVEIIDMR